MEGAVPVAGRRNQPFVALALILVLAAGLTWANYRFLETPKYAHRDIMSLWGGGWAVVHGVDPYDAEEWRPLRLELGSKWATGDAVNPYPLWTLLLFTPLSLLPLGWATALWLTFSQLLLGACVLAWMTRLAKRRPGIGEFALLAVGAFTFRATLVSLHNGQVTLFLLAVLTAFLLLEQRGRPFTAGFVLAFILVKPNPFFLLVPLLALWLLLRRRWRTAAGGLAALALFAGASWLVDPGWLDGYLSVTDKTSESVRSFIMPTLWGLGTEISVQWTAAIGLALALATTAGVGWYVFTRRDLDAGQVLALAIPASLLVTPYAWAYEHALLLLPLGILFLSVKLRPLAWAGWAGLILILPWILYRASEVHGRGTPEVLVPLLAAGFVLASIIFSRSHSLAGAGASQ
ncbi:MAG: glycosyltransferase 87 family protein [Candidatus Promineifilaceae bacterium]